MIRGGALPWPRRIRGRFPENLARASARVRSATSLKINSVKEPTDIRGLREDLTPQTRFLILSRSISLRLARLAFLYVRSPIHNSAHLPRLSHEHSLDVLHLLSSTFIIL